MAGEAVSGRYGAARHAVADEGGSRRHPASDDRSLVDRLLEGSGEDQPFDWGWGDPAAGGREPLHDIPELWGPDERAARDADEPEEGFPTPRLHDESSRPADRGADDLDWSDRDRDDLGSDDWGSPAPDLDRELPPDDQRFDGSEFAGDPLDALSAGRVPADPGPLGDDAADHDVPQPDPMHDGRMDGEHDAEERNRPDRSPLAPPLPDRSPDNAGRDLLDQNPPERSWADRDGPEQRAPGVPADRGASPSPRGRFEHGPGVDGRDQPAPEQPERKLDSDPRLRRWANLGRPSGPPSERTDRPTPFADEHSQAEPVGSNVFDSEQPGSNGAPSPFGAEWGGPDSGRADRGGPEQPGSNGAPRSFGPEPVGPDVVGADRVRPYAGGLDARGPDFMGPNPGGPNPIGAEPVGADAAGSNPFGPSPLGPERAGPNPAGQNPAGPDPVGSDAVGPNSVGPNSVGAEWPRPDVSGPERGGPDRGGPDQGGPEWGGPERGGLDPVGAGPRGDVFAPEQGAGPRGGDRDAGARFGAADLFGPGPDDRPDAAPDPRDAGSSPDPTESLRTGRIRLDDGPGADRPRPEPPGGDPAGRDRFDQAPSPVREPRDEAPDPTTAFAAVAPPRRGAPEEPAIPLAEYAERRRAAEQAAASAEQAASAAAERASAAIAAAARAAEEAEAAAEAAAKAADEASEAAEVEARALAEADARGEAPAPQEPRADAPEPPTQAVPLIAPARAPRRPPLRRPAGPPPRGVRPEEPGRAGGPPPRAAQRGGPPEEGRDDADGEATTVLTGLDALRDPVRPRSKEPASTEVTTVTRRRRPAEHAPAADDGGDEEPDQDDEPEKRGLVGRLTSRPVIAAVGVGAVLVLAAIVAVFTTSEPEASPAEATPAALSAPVEQPVPPPAPAIDPDGPKAVAFLTALRDADIPTSSSGQAETEAAAAICTQLDQGADEAQLARSVPAVLPDVTRSQASDVVDFAQQNYC